LTTAQQTVVVTGANGFIAQHCVLALLRAGFRVRGTVRSATKAAHLKSIVNRSTELRDQLELVEAHLERDEAWHTVMRGAHHVLHVASPFPATLPANENDLIVPATEGTRRVLRAASAAGVRRVVVTSSIAAIVHGAPGEHVETYDESHWTVPTKGTDAYVKSKTLAERAAWDFVERLPPGEQLELVIINPGSVLGPTLDDNCTTSLIGVRKLLSGRAPGAPRFGNAVVDVRDVARMHLSALTTPQAAGQRFICAGDFAWLVDIARLLDRHFGGRGYPVPTREVPNWLVRLITAFDRSTWGLVHHLDQRREVSHERAFRIFGWKPRPLEETVVATGASLISREMV